MTITRNPFDTGGYSLAEMTQAINILPNLYTRLAQIGLFRFEGVTQRSVVIEQHEGVLSLLPSVPMGAPATVGTREGRSMRSFALPWIPHDDVILPADIQGIPAIGVSDAADPLLTVMNRKLTLMRRKHAQTREYMEINALRGIVKDGAGTTLYNYFTEFGLAQISVDFLLGTAGTNVQGIIRTVLRGIEDNLLGETKTNSYALVSSEFFDKLISHSKTADAYKFFSATGGQPLREDMRRNFPFAGILFEEYNGSVTLSDGTSERLIPAGEGIAFPLGTFDTFT
ncbi:MAG: major capsid protein, partial [Eudoraea sp.]